MAKEEKKHGFWWVPIGAALVLLGGFILVSLATWDAGDPPMPDYPANLRVQNACGRAGAWTASYTRYAFGWPSYGVGLWVVLAGASVLRRHRDGPIILAGSAVLIVTASYGAAILQARQAGLASQYLPAPGLGGGVFGIVLARSTYAVVGGLGSIVLLILFGLAGLWLVFGLKLVEATHRLWEMRPSLPSLPRIPLPALEAGAPAPERERSLTIDLAEPGAGAPDVAEERRGKAAEQAETAEDEEEGEEALATEPLRIFIKNTEVTGGDEDESDPTEPETDPEPPAELQPEPTDEQPEEMVEDDPAAADGDIALDPEGSDGGDGGEGSDVEAEGDLPAESVIDALPVETVEKTAGEDAPVIRVEPRREEPADYDLPPFDLLDKPSDEFAADNEAEIREKAQVLERTVNEFNIKARVVRIQRGPVITMYELALAAGIKVSRVESLSDDLAMALKAPNVRIVAPLPGKSTVGVEVPNTRRETVQIREILQEKWEDVRKMAIPLFLGRDAAGTALVTDLSQAPHMLIAGQTGSGKSVCINSIITSILMTRTPRQVQLLLIDPKSVELADFKEVPHLISPVVVDMKKAAAVLEWACKKMEERYALLARVGARNIAAYNKLPEKEIRKRLDPEGEANLEDVPFRLPYIVMVVDELGELMMVAAKEVENSVIRLSQKSRAVGIHLICATQRPSVDVITGLIKANLPCRIAFQVASKVDSRTILDRNGAEKLLGRGDMLFLPPGTSSLIRSQGGYVSDEEIRRVTEHLGKLAKPSFINELRTFQNVESTDFASEDDLYVDACRIVLANQRGSVSLLQRKLGIGYGRAARLIDMMAEQGLVGDYKGSQAREVAMSLEEWEARISGEEQGARSRKAG